MERKEEYRNPAKSNEVIFWVGGGGHGGVERKGEYRNLSEI